MLFTHCSSVHLTLFAGGLVIAPSIINYQYVFVQEVFNQSRLVYLFIILITCVYVCFAVWARCMDFRDKKKLNIVTLKDNNPRHGYLYELIVFTGNRSEAGTRSQVKRKKSKKYLFNKKFSILIKLDKYAGCF